MDFNCFACITSFLSVWKAPSRFIELAVTVALLVTAVLVFVFTVVVRFLCFILVVVDVSGGGAGVEAPCLM